MNDLLWILLLVGITLGLDVGLMSWLRRYLAREGVTKSSRYKPVYLLGVYSPLLTFISSQVKGWYNRSESELQEKDTAETGEKSAGVEKQEEDLESEAQIHTSVQSGEAEVKADSQPGSGEGDLSEGNGDTSESPKQAGSVFAWLENQPGWRLTLLEGAIIVLGVTLYCWGILNLGSTRQLPGNEAQLFQAVDLVLRNSLLQQHQFPLWNPFIQTGIPYLGDPMLHIYNPFISVPTLVLGVQAGFKLALFFSFLLGALGMWALGGVLGFSRPTRVWIALMYAFAGQPVARFFQGEYLLIFGFAWIPWVLVSLIRLVETRRKLFLGTTALTLALLYFCGNAYYTFLIFFVIGLFALVTLLKFQVKRPWVHLEPGLIKTYTILGLLTLGVVAIQLLPSIEFWPRMNKGIDVQGSHTLWQIFLDYTSKDTFRQDAYSQLPAREEFYAYIGYTPFLALVALPFAFLKGRKKYLLFFGLVLAFAIIWIDLDRMPWRDLYYDTKWLSQFRHVLRALIFGSLALIVMAGMGLDSLWKLLRRVTPEGQLSGWRKSLRVVTLAGLTAIVLFMCAGVWDLFSTNHKYVNTQEDFPPIYRVMRWLRQADEGEYYVRNNPNNGWMMAVLSAKLRFIDAWYHWNDIRNFDNQLNTRAVNARPNYIVQAESEIPPTEADASLMQQMEGYAIYRLPDSLPFAFSVPLATLTDTSIENEISAEEVTAWTPYVSSNQNLEVIAQGDGNDILVVLVTHYPGWQVKVDGRAARLEKVGGYLATPLLPGVHKYTFAFIPIPFFIGVLISLVCLGYCLTLIVKDSQQERRAWIEAARQAWRALGGWKRHPAGWRPQGVTLIKAVHQGGVLKPEGQLALAENESVQLYVEAGATQASASRQAYRRWIWASGLLVRSVVSSISLEGYFFVIAVGTYLLTRLLWLTDFPIYFFTDEAVQTVSAIDLVRNHFFSPEHILLPTFFKNGTFYNLSLSVYLQLVPYLLFGQSVYLTRLVPVLVTLVAAISVGLILRNNFQVRYWWLGTMLLSIAPAWFLHSRTAFETAIFTSCYAGFLYFYLQYRQKSPRYLFACLVFAALSFYAYSPGQMVIAVTGVALFFSDLRYHWQQRKWLLGGVVLIAILASPYVRFIQQQSDAPFTHLRNLDSYWTQPIPLAEKATRYLREYAYGLNPAYWFFPNEHDLPRHLMRGYGHLFWWTLPFALIGLALAVKNIRQSAYRVLLVAILAAPTGSALVGIGITRVLVFVIPATILTALGLVQCLDWLRKPAWYQWLGERFKLKQRFHLPTLGTNSVQLCLMLILLAINFGMLRDVVVNAPTWYDDYGLYGMQYGAPQIFEQLIPRLLQEGNENIFVSSIWANGADIFPRFFQTPEQQKRISMGSIDTFLSQERDFDPATLFILTAEEYTRVMQSNKMQVLDIVDIIPYPNGEPGFYTVHLAYNPNANEIFSSEAEERKKLVEESLSLWGQQVQVLHSQIDSGKIADIFDDDFYSLARGLEANPFILELDFSKPVSVSGVKAAFGSMNFSITVYMYLDDEDTPVKLSEAYQDNPNDPQVEMDFGQEYSGVRRLRFEILNLNEADSAKIHIRELQLIP